MSKKNKRNAKCIVISDSDSDSEDDNDNMGKSGMGVTKSDEKNTCIEEEVEDCPICLCGLSTPIVNTSTKKKAKIKFNKETATASLPSCVHRFHVQCIEQWSKVPQSGAGPGQVSSCPLCKAEFDQIIYFHGKRKVVLRVVKDVGGDSDEDEEEEGEWDDDDDDDDEEEEEDEDDGTCHICSDPEYTDPNDDENLDGELLQCEGVSGLYCDACVHRFCIGAGDEINPKWTCSECLAELESQRVASSRRQARRRSTGASRDSDERSRNLSNPRTTSTNNNARTNTITTSSASFSLDRYLGPPPDRLNSGVTALTSRRPAPVHDAGIKNFSQSSASFSRSSKTDLVNDLMNSTIQMMNGRRDCVLQKRIHSSSRNGVAPPPDTTRSSIDTGRANGDVKDKNLGAATVGTCRSTEARRSGGVSSDRSVHYHKAQTCSFGPPSSSASFSSSSSSYSSIATLPISVSSSSESSSSSSSSQLIPNRNSTGRIRPITHGDYDSSRITSMTILQNMSVAQKAKAEVQQERPQGGRRRKKSSSLLVQEITRELEKDGFVVPPSKSSASSEHKRIHSSLSSSSSLFGNPESVACHPQCHGSNVLTSHRPITSAPIRSSCVVSGSSGSSSHRVAKSIYPNDKDRDDVVGTESTRSGMKRPRASMDIQGSSNFVPQRRRSSSGSSVDKTSLDCPNFASRFH